MGGSPAGEMHHPCSSAATCRPGLEPRGRPDGHPTPLPAYACVFVLVLSLVLLRKGRRGIFQRGPNLSRVLVSAGLGSCPKAKFARPLPIPSRLALPPSLPSPSSSSSPRARVVYADVLPPREYRTRLRAAIRRTSQSCPSPLGRHDDGRFPSFVLAPPADAPLATDITSCMRPRPSLVSPRPASSRRRRTQGIRDPSPQKKCFPLARRPTLGRPPDARPPSPETLHA
ncbi:hypothetical protein DCS_02147 [Drechmeria coniospora]|uniref:Uncharacterized protein n=1 Tax=Drechmeria coniospora TaxID=98403 RepID=A0A151GV66_DRECN|nr:hypothetical protein DCS_02147 [Drechmeria coniospora]KYK61007.1 hypothetical protein DCS_02147 [Drechmeria coniospora]